MKSFLTAVGLSIASFVLYKNFGRGAADTAPPLVIELPVYAQMRASADIEGREIEMAVFVAGEVPGEPFCALCPALRR